MIFGKLFWNLWCAPPCQLPIMKKSGDVSGSGRGVQAFFGEGSLKRLPGRY